MTTMRLLAPVVVDFGCVAGSALRDPVRYAAFWADCQRRAAERLATTPAPAPLDVAFTHTVPTSSLNLYRTLDDDSSGRPFHLLEGRLSPSQVAGHLPAERQDDEVDPVVRDISFRLHDHGILLVEAVLEVGPSLSQHPEPQAGLEALQQVAVALGEQVAAHLVSEHLDPLLDEVREHDRDHEFVLPATPLDDPARGDFGQPMWVTRSLFVSPRADRGRDDALRHWLKDVAVADETSPPAEQLIAGERDSCVRWVNYAFVDPDAEGAWIPHGSPHRDQWEGLRHAQVFYAALDRVDSLLSRVLADSAAADSGWELQHLRQHLLDLSQRAELVIMERSRLSKYLSRPVRGAMDELLDVWDHDQLVEAPVRFKIEMCDRRLAELAARRGARSALFTDLILLGIGVTSILGTALAVTEFGRSATQDPDQSGYDLGRSSLIEWFAGQPADAILVASGTVSLLLVALYLFFRRDDG